MLNCATIPPLAMIELDFVQVFHCSPDLAAVRTVGVTKAVRHGLRPLPSPYMADETHDAEPTQKTQPKGKDEHGKPYEPVEIPIPTRDAVLRDLTKGVQPAKQERRV